MLVKIKKISCCFNTNLDFLLNVTNLWLILNYLLIFSLALKEIRNAFDLFKLTPEEKNDVSENNRKREEIPLDFKTIDDHKTKENKQSLKERRNTRDETDTWAYIAAEGDQEGSDSVCQADENSGEFGIILQNFSR